MRRRFKIELLLVALVCLGPVIAAYWLYYYGDLNALPLVDNPDRVLVQPAVPLPSIAGLAAGGEAVENLWAESKWFLVHARTSACDRDCGSDRTRLRQVHAALGRDQNRVRLVYLGPDATALSASDPEAAVAPLDGGQPAELIAALEAAGPLGTRGRVYVVDPHGNLVMGYPPDAEQEGLLEDLERLLDISRIG